jgi:hypothetical protein
MEESMTRSVYMRKEMDLEKHVTPKCGYLKPVSPSPNQQNVIRGHLQINSMKDMIKFARSRGEKVKKLSLFFFK